MKKILTIFGIMLITLFALTINAHAYTYSVSLQPAKTELKAGDTVTIDIMISSLALETNEAGIIGFEAGLNYDSAIFSKASVSGEGYWTEGENITKVRGILLTNEVKTTGKIATITLTVAEAAEVGETAVALKNISTSNGVSDAITASDASVKFTVVEASNNTEDETDDTNKEENKNDNVTDDTNKEENKNDNVTDNTNKEDNKDDNVTDDKNKEENKDNNTNKEENKPDNTNKEENKNNTANNTTNKNNTTKDNTIANKVISAAGLENISALVVGTLVVIAGISYISYKKYKNM